MNIKSLLLFSLICATINPLFAVTVPEITQLKQEKKSFSVWVKDFTQCIKGNGDCDLQKKKIYQAITAVITLLIAITTGTVIYYSLKKNKDQKAHQAQYKELEKKKKELNEQNIKYQQDLTEIRKQEQIKKQQERTAEEKIRQEREKQAEELAKQQREEQLARELAEIEEKKAKAKTEEIEILNKLEQQKNELFLKYKEDISALERQWQVTKKEHEQAENRRIAQENERIASETKQALEEIVQESQEESERIKKYFKFK